ncbi:MAG: FkbM family methyltransferase [Planctomycetaceae bacterium]|nr:FkbM family methyltransferase [Planctomycetaceae bacterium]
MNQPNSTESPTWLLDYRRDVYSQCGEDGILEKVLELIPDRDFWCVEFGAWDGEYMSNTCRLTESDGYSAVLIEGDTSRAEALKAKYAHNSKIHAVNRFVGHSDNNNLDTILAGTPIPKNFDLLSIDIDGNDYHVWNATSEYRPKVVIIEFNPTIPTEVDFIQEPSPDVNQGCGLSSVVRLGRQKGYELVSVTAFNAVFVRSEYFAAFGISDNRPETLRTDLSAVTWLFSGFDGRVILHGSQSLPWHKLPIRPSQVQQLPAIFRGHPHSFGRIRKSAFKLYKKVWNLLNHLEHDDSQGKAA